MLFKTAPSHPFILILLFIFLPFGASCQTPVKASFTVEGEVTRPLKLTADQLAQMTTREVKGKDKDGKEHTFKGVPLSAILDSAGVTTGGQLRGANLTKYIRIKAADGYKVIFSLPEVDPEFTNQTIILAYLVDGKPLGKGEGPFRIVAPAEKKHARWIREVTSIRIVRAKD